MCRNVKAALLFVVLFAGTAVSQPGWVKSKTSDKFPDRFFMIGVGFANKTSDRAADLRKAYDAAFADIAKQIKSTVASQSSTQEYEVLSAEKSSLESQTSAEIKVSTEVKLGGLKVVDTYDDEDNNLVWALAVLNRTAASDQLKETLTGYLGGYERSRDLSMTNPADVYTAMMNLADMFREEVQYNALLPIYKFIAGPLMAVDSSYGMHPALLIGEAKGEAQSLLAGLRIEKVSGDTQSVSMGSAVQPLVVKVVRDDGNSITPLRGMPMNFAFTQGKGKLTERATTDHGGKARCSVFSLLPYAGDVYSVSASLDLSAFGSDDRSSGEFEEWNRFLERNESGVSFSMRRSSRTLDDKLSDAVMLVSSRLPDTTATITVSRIFFQGKLPGAMAEFLRQRLEQAIQVSTPFSIVSQEAVRNSQMALSDAGSLQNLSQPDFASHAAGARYVLTGDYWKEDENLDLNVKVVDVSTHVLVGTATAVLPLSMLPKVPLAPENYNPVRDENIIKTERKGEDLKVEVWVDRIDGVYHEADTMSIYVRANVDCYVQLVYNDASGNSLLIFPNKVALNNRIRGGTVYKVPGPFVVRPPFGREILKAYASSHRPPVPQGREINNLVLLSSATDFQQSVRDAGMAGDMYAESAIVLTTMQAPDR